MARDGLLIGQLAKATGVSRKATSGGYRVYGAEALGIVTFVRQAQGLGFRLEEIRQFVSIRRSEHIQREEPHGR